MKTSIIYARLAQVYRLLDAIYFRVPSASPRQAVINLIPKNPCRVLDVCTGTGILPRKIGAVRPDARILGIDRSREMLEVARRDIRKSGEKNIWLKCMDATDTGLKTESFDVVILSLVLHETEEKLAQAMVKEAYRVLRPDGRLLIMEWEKPAGWKKNLLFYPILTLEPKGFREFLALDYEKWFATCGFSIQTRTHCDYSVVMECVKTGIIQSGGDTHGECNPENGGTDW